MARHPLLKRLSASMSFLALFAGGSLLTARSAAAADSEIVVARAMDLNSLDPARAYCDTCQIYLSAVYDTLVTIAPDNKTVIPDLAETWEVSPDVTTFTFHLNPAAKFSDGSPVTGDDVKWSLERLQNIKGGASYLMTGLKSITVPDPHNRRHHHGRAELGTYRHPVGHLYRYHQQQACHRSRCQRP